ncbi:MAG: oxidoreductase, partial [Mesorhizobium sp.]
VRGIKSGGFEVTFPYRTSWPLKILGMLPRPLCRWVIILTTSWKARPLHYERKPPNE